ncbi:MAG: YceI family protein [Bacteroidia bacterium]
MKIRHILAFGLLIGSLIAANNHDSTLYSTNTGTVNFFSHTDIEDIEGENHKVKAAFDAKSGKIQFSLLVKDFEFEKSLMEEHFNENYMESTKYPRATFSGTIDQIEKIDLSKDGQYSSPVSGKLKIKDVVQEITALGTFTVKNGVVNGKSEIVVHPEDYHIKIPKVVRNKISNDIVVSMDVDFKHKH